MRDLSLYFILLLVLRINVYLFLSIQPIYSSGIWIEFIDSKSTTMSSRPVPLLPLYEKETPEEEAARGLAQEQQDAQPDPMDNPCTAMSKWLARNSGVIKKFGLMSAVLLGMRALQQSSLFSEDVSDLSLQSDQGPETNHALSNLLREMEVADTQRRLAVDDESDTHNGDVLDSPIQSDQGEHADDDVNKLLQGMEMTESRRRSHEDGVTKTAAVGGSLTNRYHG